MRLYRPSIESARLRNLFGLCIALTLVLAASGSLHAQTEDEYEFDDIPVDDARQYYVAVGGGYLGMLVFPNFDELNKLSARVGVPDFEGQLLMNGGGGLISPQVIPNLRVGVFGAGGSRTSQASVTLNGVEYNRSLRFGSVVTGGQVDYAIRLFRSFTILPGVMLGGGTYTLEMSQSRAEGEEFNNVFPDADESLNGNNRYARITRSHLFYYPAVNLEYAFTQFIMMRAGAGYSGTAFDGLWVDDGGTQINNVPAISASGLTLQFGLFIGLFQTQ